MSKKSWILCAAGNISVMCQKVKIEKYRDQKSTVEVVYTQTSQNFHTNQLP